MERLAKTLDRPDDALVDCAAACPMAACVVCGTHTCTRELHECSRAGHMDGVELAAGGWVCSGECWEAAAYALEP